MVNWSSLISNKSVVAAVAASVAAVVAVHVYWSRRAARQQQQQMSADYELVGEVAALNCYPVKSLPGFSGPVAFCTKTGIRMNNTMDRHFVIVKLDGSFITQRTHPQMALVRVEVQGQEIVLTAKSMTSELRVPLHPPQDPSKIVNCRVWEDRLDAQDCGMESSAWLSQCLQEKGLRLLVLLPGMTKRPARALSCEDSGEIGFPDKGAYLVATEESLADLRSRITSTTEDPVTLTNFRPNIVIKNTKGPWDEDTWKSLRIGKNLEMKVCDPCGRCLLTTVDPKRGEKRVDQEPLKTLKTFRIFPEKDKSPLFGVFTRLEHENTIRVGDPVYSLRK